MNKKILNIDHNILDAVLLGFVFALLTVFVVEHLSTYSYIPNLGKPIISYGGQVIRLDSFETSTTPIGSLYQITPCGTKISLPTNGMMCSELVFKDSDFKKYSNQVILYFKAIFSDYKYLLQIAFAYAMIILFFKKYRLRLS